MSKKQKSRTPLVTTPAYRGTKSLSHALDIVTKPVFVKRGFAENRIITDWSKIVGTQTAIYSTPRKLTFAREKKANGTLYIEVNNSGFATELTYLEPVILEKIAGYFGYKAVSRLKILQHPQNNILTPTRQIIKKSLSINQATALERSLADIEDEELRTSLRTLGTRVMTNNSDEND